MKAHFLSLSLALAFPAGAFELGQPVDCALGDTCYIQQGFDHDHGPQARDFTCGTLAYDGHDGTDFALPTRAAMDAGVNVIAAAGGTVKGVRDGVPDAAPFPLGQDCGNGVVIDHGGAWETQYCHLKLGSVVVRSGEIVQAGTPLGQIGQSGNAEFPHMHLSVRQNNQEIDPFAPDATACGGAGDDLWSGPINLAPGGFLAAGFSDHVPEFAAIKSGQPFDQPTATSDALVLWLYLFGTQSGDAIIVEIAGPDGPFLTERIALDRTQALSFRAIGRKLKTDAWPPGAYNASATLIRRGIQIDAITAAITLP
jgi:murein DD-endopeptidase MepM/ murein hydrolase activator NlpD